MIGQQGSERLQVIRRALPWLVGVLALGFCLGTAVKYWKGFEAYRGELSAGLLVLGLGASLAGYWSCSLGWHVLMSGLGSPIRLRTALRSWSYSQVAKYVPGKVLVFVTRVQVCQEDAAPPSKVMIGSGLEIALSVASALTIWLFSSLLAPYSQGPARLLCAIPLALIILGVHPRVLERAMGLYYRWRKRPQEVPRMSLGAIAKPAALYFLGWVFYGLGGYLILRSFMPRIPASVGAAVRVAGALNFAWLIGYLFFLAPGGLGAREATLAAMLAMPAPLVPVHVGLVIASLLRLCQIGLELGLAAVLWIWHAAAGKKALSVAQAGDVSRLASRPDAGTSRKGNPDEARHPDTLL